MELSRMTVRALIVLMTVALGGILYLQYRVWRSNLEMREDAFGRNAVSALNYAAERLEEIDARERLFEAVGDSGMPITVRVEKREHDRPSHGRDSVVMLSVVTSPGGGLSTRLINGRLTYELDSPQRVAVKIFDVFGRLDTTVLDGPRGAGTYDVELPEDRMARGVFFVRVETDSATSTLRWNKAGGEKWTMETGDNENRTRRIVGRLTETVGSGVERNLGDRLQPGLVDSLIGEGLARGGILIPYEYAVRDFSCDSLVVKRLGEGADEARFQYSTVLFPLGFSGTPGEILIRFPGYRSHLLGGLLPELLLNIFLIGLVVGCFWYAIRTLTRQKEFAGRLSDFINNMTHEFKTPLSTIALSTEAIARPDVASDHGRLETYNTIISDEQKRMKSQVDRILQMAALEEGELEFRVAVLDMHQIIRRAVVNVSLQVEERGGTVETSLRAGNPRINGDAVHVENVIHNLLDNANKYSPEVPRVEIGTRNTGDSLVVTVSDTGIGIAHDQLEKIFEKYYRVPTQNVHDVKGFGLGLSYVRLVVEKHGGKARAESREGRGTTVEITFPSAHG